MVVVLQDVPGVIPYVLQAQQITLEVSDVGVYHSSSSSYFTLNATIE